MLFVEDRYCISSGGSTLACSNRGEKQFVLLNKTFHFSQALVQYSLSFLTFFSVSPATVPSSLMQSAQLY